MLEGITPILRVQSLPLSLDYYVKVLGFKVNWQNPGIMAGISTDLQARPFRPRPRRTFSE